MLVSMSVVARGVFWGAGRASACWVAKLAASTANDVMNFFIWALSRIFTNLNQLMAQVNVIKVTRNS
jgi:hypothetical protein